MESDHGVDSSSTDKYAASWPVTWVIGRHGSCQVPRQAGLPLGLQSSGVGSGSWGFIYVCSQVCNQQAYYRDIGEHGFCWVPREDRTASVTMDK